jgi:hypothetical protein
MRLSSWDRAFLWPFLETRRLLEAVGRSWRRILVGAFVGWALAVVLGAVALVTLEQLGFISHHTSDTLGIAIVLAGVGLGALGGYATGGSRSAEVRPREGARPTSAVVSARPATSRLPASTFSSRGRGSRSAGIRTKPRSGLKSRGPGGR